MKPKSAFVHVAVVAGACAGAIGGSCAMAAAVADSAAMTVALADMPTSDAYAHTVGWTSRGGLAKAPAIERSVGLASMQRAQPAFSRPRSEAGADESSRNDADLEGWSLAAAALGIMVFMARRRLPD